MSYKVIILDVDGTLLSDKGMLPETKKALIKAQDMGIKIILASGPPTSGLVDIGKELHMDKHGGLYASYNGSKIVDCETGETLFNDPLSIEDGKAVIEHMKNFDVYPMIDKDRYMYVNNVYPNNTIRFKGKDYNIVKEEVHSGNYLLCEQDDLAVFLDYKVNKVLTAAPPEYL